MSNKAKKHHQADGDEESGDAPNSDLTSKLVSGAVTVSIEFYEKKQQVLHNNDLLLFWVSKC